MDYGLTQLSVYTAHKKEAYLACKIRSHSPSRLTHVVFNSNPFGITRFDSGITVAHKCNGETKSHGKSNFNSRHNKINLQSNETSGQNKTNSRQNNINSRQNNINSRQNKISSRQNENKLTAKYTLTHGKIQSTHGKTK